MVLKDNPILFLDDGGEGIPVPVEALVQAIVILCVDVLIIVTNVIIIATFITAPGPKEVMTYYLLSLSVADLLAGVVVVPLSVYPTLIQTWVYGEIICNASGFLGCVLWTKTNFVMMWLSVDRYVAVRKPAKYDTVQTKTKVQCWVAMSWITALMLCCPPLLGFQGAEYDNYSSMCLLRWNLMPAYAGTLATLILGPTLTTMVYSYIFIFNSMRQLKYDAASLDKEYASALAVSLANPSHVQSFVLVLFFWLTWIPWLSIKLFEYLVTWKIPVPFLHFSVFWVGLGNSFLKLFIYIIVNGRFRFQLRLFCLSICCRNKGHGHRRNSD